MTIEHAIWKINAKSQPLQSTKLESEEKLEETIDTDISILNDRWLIIGRQMITTYGGKIDLLAIGYPHHH